MPIMCQSYCSHGGRCVLRPGHQGLHDSKYCKWNDTEALTKAEADRVLAQTDRGQDYLDNLDPFAEFIEAMADDITEE